MLHKPSIRRLSALLAAGLLAAAPLAARAEPVAPALQSALITHTPDLDMLGFYGARGYVPLWLTADGAPSPAAEALVQLVATAQDDGVDPRQVSASELAAAVQALGQDRSSAAQARAELALSRSFASYVRALRQGPADGMVYQDDAVRPQAPSRAAVLRAAADAPTLADYVRDMRWMNPLYGQLRQAMLAAPAQDEATRRVVIGNLQRLRALPAPPRRYVLVNAATARLFMYEDGRAIDSMKVVVGKPTLQTPLISGTIRYAILNPYWNVPDDVLRNKIGPNVVLRGVGYFQKAGYEVFQGWSADGAMLDPTAVDWRAVVEGAVKVRVRQRPGIGNAMGKVKFEFPNPLGIYLHDTPEKALLQQEGRQFSSGCIRLEDADRLGRWLMHGALPAGAGSPEQKIDLPESVPVYVTYLTAQVEDGRLALGPDPYGRDRAEAPAMAQKGEVMAAALK